MSSCYRNTPPVKVCTTTLREYGVRSPLRGTPAGEQRESKADVCRPATNLMRYKARWHQDRLFRVHQVSDGFNSVIKTKIR